MLDANLSSINSDPVRPPKNFPCAKATASLYCTWGVLSLERRWLEDMQIGIKPLIKDVREEKMMLMKQMGKANGEKKEK